jgi:hypothetical protein
MMRRRNAGFGLIAVAAVLTAVAVPTVRAQEAPEPGAATFAPETSGVLECKRASTGHVLVRCSVNGHEPGWFIFDTGAGICVVSTPRVGELGLKDAGALEAVGVGGAESARMVMADSLAVGPLTLRDHPMLVTDLSFLRPHLGEDITGVIGYGVLARSVVALDLDAPSVTILAPDDASLAELDWDPLELIGRVPAVRARFEGHEGLFRLDSGANGHVTFHQPAVESLGLLEGRTLNEARIGGVGGTVRAKGGELAWFELGGVRTERVPAVFAVEAKGTFAEPDRAGNVGIELLRPFVLHLDYGRSRIAFVRRE